MKRSEHNEQAALIRWTMEEYENLPELALLLAIPNGEHRAWSVAKRLKAEGLKAGVPDLFLPVARGGFHGLWIEMKAGKGRPGKEQKLWKRALEDQGYMVLVCYGASEAGEKIEGYLMNQWEAGAPTGGEVRRAS